MGLCAASAVLVAGTSIPVYAEDTDDPAAPAAPGPVAAESRAAGFAVEDTAGGVIIRGLGGITLDDGKLSIPSLIDGKKVLGIAEGAFRNAGVKTLAFEPGVELDSIGAGAFQGNQITGDVKIPATTIGDNAFSQNKITGVELTGTTKVGKDAFRDNEITSLTLDPPTDTPVELDERAFINNKLSDELDLTKAGTVGDEAFGTNGLRTVKVGDKTSIGEKVFANNGAWVELKIADEHAGDRETRGIATGEYDSGHGQVVNPVTVVVRYLDQDGNEILPDETLGRDPSAGGSRFEKDKEATYTPREISGYTLETKSIMFTPDRDGFAIEAKYTRSDKKPVFKFPGSISLSKGEKVTSERLKRGVTARAYDGTDVTNRITVDTSAVDSSVPGFYEVVYSVTDAEGNETVDKRMVSVGTSWGEYEFGGGWQIQDFEYSYGRLQGLSASGKQKLAAGKTTLWIPPVDRAGDPVYTIGSDAFKGSGFTGIGGTWQNVRAIDRYAFHGNKLQTIPDSWGNVHRLGYESFGSNNITQLPESWGDIEALPDYVFRGNKIAALPKSWGKITSIGNRALERNQIQALPEDWGEVRVIGDYAFSSNSFDLIPKNWGKVEKIGPGAFAHLGIKEIPDDWANVTYIGSSAFSGNKLTRIPTSWGKAKAGSSSFSNNQITEIPDNWSDWTAIPSGLFHRNRITTLPDSWGDVTSIGADAFWENQITAIPDNWGKVRQIGISAFSQNRLTEIPSTWGDVEKLDSRVFQNNRITSIPDDWGKVDRINYLLFGYNPIGKIPDSWGNVTWISGFAFQGTGIKRIPDDWGKITGLSADALVGTQITSLPESWGNIKSIGRDAFSTSSLQNYTDTSYLMPTENLTQGFIDGLNRSKLPKTITLYTFDGETPPGLTLPPGIKVNPVKVVVRFVDEQGNAIGPKESVREGQMSTAFTVDPPAIYGYKTPQPVTATLGKDREQVITIVYPTLPQSEVPDDTTVTLRLNNKTPYQIGSNMTGSVKVDRTGYATQTLNDVRVRFDLDPTVYDLDTFDITTSALGIDRDTIKREGSSVSFIIPSIGASQTLNIPFRVNFKKGPTPSNTPYPIQVTLVDQNNAAVAESNVESFTGYYPMPSEKITVPGENIHTGEIPNYDQMTNEDDPSNPSTFVSDNVPGKDVKNKITYNICVNGLERNVGDYTIAVPVPTYRVHPKSGNYNPDQSNQPAEFDPAKNPGWKLSDDGTQLFYVGHNRNTRGGICQPLVLGYPGALEWEKFSVTATTTMTPTDQPQTEPYIVTSDSHSNYFGRSVPPPGRALVKQPTGNHGGFSNNYFYDNAKERNGQFPWTIGFNVEKAADKVTIRDYGLDERMYYDTVTLPVSLGNVNVVVLDANGATLDFRTVYTSHPRTITFQREKVEDAAEILIESLSSVEAKTSGSIGLTSRLRDPDTVIYDQQPEVSKYFHNSASLEINGAPLGHVTARKTVLPHKQEIAAFKTQQGYNEVGEPISKLITGDYLHYTVGFTPNESFGETITNIEVVDLLPIGVDLDSVSMTAEFSTLPGARYEIIDNYRGSGHTAVIFRASSASAEQIRPGFRFTAGLIKVKINLLVDGDHLVNDVFVKAQNTALSNSVQDDRLGDDYWSKAFQETSFEPAAAMETSKRIRTYNKDGSAGPWLFSVTTEPGAKLDYSLRLTNGTEKERGDLVIYDVFPHVGDQGIPKPRHSEFANAYDPTREPKLPDGYTISYYNGDSWPVYDGTRQQTDAVLSALQWDSTPTINTKAVRIVQNDGVKLKARSSAEIILPFTANADRVDKFGNPPADLLGKTAYNTFFYKDSVQTSLLEGNRVANKLKARPISIEFTKVKENTNEPLAGATFELRNSEGAVVATAVSDEEGIVRFNNVEVLVGYKIVETKAPKGYQINTRPMVIREADLDRGFAENPAVIKLGKYANSPTPPPPVYGRLEFKKLNSEGTPLPGTRFKLSGRDSRRQSQQYLAIAAADGTVTFANVSPGTSYYLSEQVAIAPYKPITPLEGVTVEGNKTTYLGETLTTNSGEKIEHVIVNDLMRIPLFKVGIADDRARDANGEMRKFGSFGSIDGVLLSGSTFELIDAETGTVLQTIYPNTNTYSPSYVDNIVSGKVYRLREVSKPKGYEHVPGFPEEVEFKVSANGELMSPDGTPFPIQSALYVPNRKETQTSTATVQKKDQEGNVLPGAVFALERLEDVAGAEPQWQQVGDTVTSGADGVAAFTDIADGRYRIVEKQLPAGYHGKFTSPEFIGQRTVAKTFTFNAVNTRMKPSVAKIEYIAQGLPNQEAAIKVRDKNPGSAVIRRNGAWEVVKYLPGATFEVREGDKNGAQIEEVTTGADGKAAITVPLDPNKTYTLVETKAPDGYSVPETPVSFTPATMLQFEQGREPGTFTVYAPNNKDTGRIIVSKTDRTSGESLLDGQAQFSATPVDKVTDGSEKADDIVVDGVRYRPKSPPLKRSTDVSNAGLAMFDKLEFGTWIVRETKAPRGYTLDPVPAVFEVSKDTASHTYVFSNAGEPEIKLTKFINGHDANDKISAVWLPANAETMDVKFVVENTGKSPLTDVLVTDRIDGTDNQYINEALGTAVFTVTRKDGTVEHNIPNGMVVLQPGDKAETTLAGMASPEINKLHRNDATVVGTWRTPNDVTDSDPAHAYRLPTNIPLPPTGDWPFLILLLLFGGASILGGIYFVRRALRKEE